jgi:hypothetical protein
MPWRNFALSFASRLLLFLRNILKPHSSHPRSSAERSRLDSRLQNLYLTHTRTRRYAPTNIVTYLATLAIPIALQFAANPREALSAASMFPQTESNPMESSDGGQVPLWSKKHCI